MMRRIEARKTENKEQRHAFKTIYKSENYSGEKVQKK